jgi:Fe-S cluster assembly protein SufD
MTTAFSSELQSQFDTLENGPLSPLREGAWQRFLELGLPQKKDEAFRTLHLRDLYAGSYGKASTPLLSKESIEPYIYPESQGSVLVFVNGTFSPELSQLEHLPKQVVIATLPDAMRTYGHFLRTRFKEERDPFAVLNGALHARGAFVYIPPKLKLPRPVQCLHFITELTQASSVTPRLHVFVGAHAEASFISRLVFKGEQSYLYNGVLDVALEEGARFHQVAVRTEMGPSWQFEAVRATLKRDSHFTHISATSGSKSFRQDIRIALLGENAAADLQGAWLLSKNLQAHTQVLVDHVAPHCRSMQRFKGILADHSQSSFEGKINVRDTACKTEAYQLNNNLILGEHALAYSKPNLEVFEGDVKASHGATISQLDPAHLFYLKTRGLSLETAQRLLLLGFCQDVIDQIPHHSIRTSIVELARSLF